VTLAEIRTGIRQLGFGGERPIRVLGDEGAAVLKLPSILVVTSEPSNATVLLNDTEKGATPAQITILVPGAYQLYLVKELHRETAKQTVEIASARGQKVVATPYQLIPITIYGTVQDFDKEIMKSVDVQIQGTAYQQAVAEDGSFSFEKGQTYGLLEQGKTYEMLAQSLDGLYLGKASFTFRGTEDIRLSISLAQSNWLEIAGQRLALGNAGAAVATLDSKLQESSKDELLQDETFASIQPALVQLFLTHMKGKIESEPDNLKWHIVAARLAELSYDVPTARRHWKAITAGADKGTEEYRRAIYRLRQTDPIRRPWIIILGLVCAAAILAILGAVGLHVRKRVRLSKFREIPNPYIAGKPISERDMFFGREDVFAFIRDKFSRDAKDITIVLHGGRRTGKTSIMYQIANGRLGRDFMPVFIDMQEMAGVDAHDFFRIIAQKVSEVHRAAVDLSEDDRTKLDELYRNLEDKSKPAYQSFNDFLTSVSSTLEDKYIIFLIDEYEILERKVNEGDITHEIFGYLRHLMQNMDNLAFIFAGSSDFGRRQRKEWALVFNMAQPREVSFLTRENALALITEPVKDYMRYEKEAVERVLRLAAGHPFFTQAMCFQIIENMNDKQQNRVTMEYVDEACNELVENAPFHLAFIWGELTPEEKVMVALLAEVLPDGLAYASADDIISKQSYYELEYDQATVNKSLARLAEEHLVEAKPRSEEHRFRMDLIRAWIQSEHPTWGVLKEVQNNE
jgi:hypothetical protein